MKERILIAGSDEVLVKTRSDLLSSSYSVSTCRPKATLNCLRSEQFELLLVYCSTPFEIASTIIHKAHEEFMHLCIVRLLSIDHPALSRPIAHAVIVIDYDRKKVAESDRSIAHTRTQSSLCLRAAGLLAF